MTDAVVIGAGPNGLVAANILADAGWSVHVLEAQAEPGGAVRSGRYVDPAYVSDLCSAFYPLGVASPVMRSLHLEEHGLEWTHAPAVLAHPLPDGRAAVLSRDLDATLASLEALAPGDGAAWQRLVELWDRVGDALLDALMTPFPPVRAGARLAAVLRPAGLVHFARFMLLPVRRLLEEEFAGPGGLLLAGNTLHTDMSPESPGGTAFGWLLAMLGQRHGFPVPVGGAAELTGALVRRLESRGGVVTCSARVREVVVRDGTAVAVRTEAGDEVAAAKAVLADVVAPHLYGGLVGWEHLPPGLREDMRRFQWDFSTVKVDFALSGPVPWTNPDVGRAGTVHIASSVDEMSEYTGQIARGRVPSDPFLLVGQMTTSDPSRSPAGTESLWAYTHVPREVRGDAGGDGITGRWDAAEAERFADRMQARIEELAPGFASRVLNRVVQAPPDLEAHDENLVLGAINGGTTAIHQQLVFRPAPGTGRPETPVRRLYLASSSAHPGGGVHGACGANAARAALHAESGVRRVLGVRPLQLLQRGLESR